MSEKKLSWKELPVGDLLEAGTADQFETGDWRTEKPLWYSERCIQCYLCWINCPDSAIIIKDGKVAGIDYRHCKGCGICAKECPKKANAIVMTAENSEEEVTGGKK